MQVRPSHRVFRRAPYRLFGSPNPPRCFQLSLSTLRVFPHTPSPLQLLVVVHPSHRLIAYFRDPSRSHPYDPHSRRSKLRQSCSLQVPPLRFPPLQRTKFNESSSHRSGRPVSKPELTSPHSLSQAHRGLILARTRQPYFMPTTFMGFSRSSGYFPLAGPR
jgi:hypothetical protein